MADTDSAGKATGSARSESRALREWAFEVGDSQRSWVVYRIVRRFMRLTLLPWLRVRGVNIAVLDLPGATVLAPVHRSHLDSVIVACLCERRLRALGKESLFRVPVLRYFCAALGAIPVRRGEADRDALVAAKSLLDRGESMIVFPEGSRQTGDEIAPLFDGAAWLAARTGARVVPIGIAGTDQALPSGAKFIHRTPVRVVVGEPMEPPTGPDGRRADREQLQEFSHELAAQLAELQSDARQALSEL